MAAATTVPEFLEALKRATAISAREESEEEPYKFHYEAADVLREALGEPLLLAASNQPEGAPSAEAPAVSAPAPAAAESSASDSAAAAAEPDGEASSAPPAVDAGTPSPAAPSTSGRPPSPQELAAAAARIRCGLILLDTDLLSDGEAYVRAGLGVLEAAPGGAEAYLAWLLEAYNSLGALYRWGRLGGWGEGRRASELRRRG